jgi:rhodanese-related sulfurtransferase
LGVVRDLVVENIPVKEKAMIRQRLYQTMWQAPLLIVLAGLVAMGVNHWRRGGITLVADWSPAARIADTAGDSLIVDLAEASRLYREEAAVFVDARPESQYAAGHIQGALNIPWQDVDRYFVETADRLAGTPTVITYCDRESCDLSHELALFLREMGFENVRVLVNGWTMWQQAGLPINNQG